MATRILIAALAGALLAAPAYAQEGGLDGAPPPLQIPKPTPPQPAAPKPAPPAPKPAPRATAPAASSAATEQQRLAQQAAAQKAEQARLTALAADLEAQKARLDARAIEITAEEKRLARLREDLDADYARQLADLDRQRSASVHASLPTTPPREAAPPSTPAYIRISYDDARRACTRAGMNEAVAHDFYSARYAIAPRFFERQRELRGPMRLDDRDGYLTVNTICRLDANGAVARFEILD